MNGLLRLFQDDMSTEGDVQYDWLAIVVGGGTIAFVSSPLWMPFVQSFF